MLAVGWEGVLGPERFRAALLAQRLRNHRNTLAHRGEMRLRWLGWKTLKLCTKGKTLESRSGFTFIFLNLKSAVQEFESEGGVDPLGDTPPPNPPGQSWEEQRCGTRGQNTTFFLCCPLGGPGVSARAGRG